MFESENIEFKSEFTEDVYKEIIAFANTDGGVVYIGIDNEGNAVGLSDVDAEYTRITNGIRDRIMPDVTMCIKYKIQENKVVRIIVNEGTNKPYYLKSKGIKYGGVYVRQGTSSVPASPELIRQMIKESDGDSFEQTTSLEQNLTFNSAEKTFQKYGVELNKEKFKTLGLINIKSDNYTNLALLLSDECPLSVKVAVFADEECTEFRDSKEFGGSIFDQFENTLSYLALCNKTVSEIKGVIRTDKKDYPDEAIREALLNAISHRDYSFSGSIIINVTDSKMEFISIGGLIPGLTIDDIKIGISQTRNKNLTNVFYRLHLVESYGTGIRRIFKLYEESGRLPLIEVTPNAFKITIFNLNFSAKREPEKISYQMKEVIDFVSENDNVNDADIEALLNIKHTRAYNLTREMIEQGLIEAVGRGKNKRYIIPD